MLTIDIQNFQSVTKKQTVTLDGITLIYGNNSSGKSIIKDTLLMGHRIAEIPKDSMPDRWVNKIALNNNECVQLAYTFTPRDFCLYEPDYEEFFLEEIILDCSKDLWRSLELDTEDSSFQLLNQYMAHSRVCISYRWNTDKDERFNKSNLSTISVYINSGEIDSDDSLQDEENLIMSINLEVYEELQVEFNKSHPLYVRFKQELESSNFLQFLSSNNNKVENVLDLNTVIYYEYLRFLSFYNYSEKNTLDFGFIFIYTFSTALNYLVGESCRFINIDGIRQVSEYQFKRTALEEEQSPVSLNHDYWKSLKEAVFSNRFGFEGNEYLDRINKWLSEETYLNTGYEVTADFQFLVSLDDIENFNKEKLLSDINHKGRMEHSTLMLKDTKTGMVSSFEDVGTGLSQVLPILYYLAQSTAHSRPIYIHQPELHLHPRLQARLAQVFVNSYILSNKSRTSIIETHSELFILRLLKIIRENYNNENVLHKRVLLAGDVKIIFTIKDNEGSTSYQKLRISKDGEFLDKWPEGFFEERDRELF